jgi:uncharacterized membrane protein AbrB (regulator of aidB expression)
MIKIENKPFLWAFITFIGVEIGFMLIDNSYFEKFQKNLLLSVTLLILKLSIFITLALFYKNNKRKNEKRLDR